MKQSRLLLAALGLALPVVTAQTCKPPRPQPFNYTEMREPCGNFELTRQPLFGDLHVHTTLSLDADLQGTRIGPDQAYLFAKGATVDIQPFGQAGQGLRTLTIDRPLDFAMVSDHAEFFGETSICSTPGLPEYESATCELYRSGTLGAFQTLNNQLSKLPQQILASPSGERFADVCRSDGQLCVDESITFWSEIQTAAEQAYDRTSSCEFTSFVGYEWTGSPAGKNLHRNVLFRNQIVPTLPTAYFEAPNVEQLWDALEAECAADGDPATDDCEFLTIPHNSNLSQGLFFKDADDYDHAQALRRQKHEPLIEVMQHKGSSECSMLSSSEDELCDFEVLTYNNLAGPTLGAHGAPKAKDHVREALKKGLVLEQSVDVGANPFKHGMIGSTDTHLATPGAVSEGGATGSYPGHGGAGAPARDEIPPGLVDLIDFNPGGLAVVWAEENSRDSLFSAMRRREVYATSGTRPIVRFFGSYDFPVDMCQSQTRIWDSYKGAPMGSDLSQAPPEQSPTFLVSALKDPGIVDQPGTDLQRIQIIKGWVDQNGDAHEQVYDVAGDAHNGASVDLDTCQPQGTGFSELCTVWTDPDFDSSERAFYYARVLENPTCRWSKRQCNAGGVDCSIPATITEGYEGCCELRPDGTPFPETVQERAWTSPIWYSPAGP